MCSPVNLLHISKTPHKNTSKELLLSCNVNYFFCFLVDKRFLQIFTDLLRVWKTFLRPTIIINFRSRFILRLISQYLFYNYRPTFVTIYGQLQIPFSRFQLYNCRPVVKNVGQRLCNFWSMFITIVRQLQSSKLNEVKWVDNNWSIVLSVSRYL